MLFAIGQYHFSKKNYTEALKYFEKAAGIVRGGEDGDRKASTFRPSLQAKYQLGVMYYDGLGVEANPVSGSSPSPSCNLNVLLWLLTRHTSDH